MKIFGYVFRKFEKENTTIQDAVETWVVKWDSLHRTMIDTFNIEEQHQAFTTKKSANLFAKELRSARMLLGDIGAEISVQVQKPPTNA